MPIEESAAKRKIPFIGLRYGKLDDKVKNLDVDLADLQFEHFGHILSDAEARELLEEQKESKWQKCPA